MDFSTPSGASLTPRTLAAPPRGACRLPTPHPPRGGPLGATGEGAETLPPLPRHQLLRSPQHATQTPPAPPRPPPTLLEHATCAAPYPPVPRRFPRRYPPPNTPRGGDARGASPAHFFSIAYRPTVLHTISTLRNLSHIMYESICFRQSNSPQSRQLIVYYCYLKYQVLLGCLSRMLLSPALESS